MCKCKQVLATLMVISMIMPNMTVYASDKETVGSFVIDTDINKEPSKRKDQDVKASVPKLSISLTNDGVDNEVYSIDPEIEYAYEGEDFVYAKVSYDGKEYAINRSEYGSFLSGLQKIGTKEEYFSPTIIMTVDEEAEESKVPVWEKDTRRPYDEWTDEQWNSYTEFAQSFDPDDWQRTLLEYYSLPEIYAYYFGLGYTIDEDGLKAKIDYEEEQAAKKEIDEVATKQVEEDYAKVNVQYDLDSMYDKEVVYCITSACMDDLNTFLLAYPLYDEEKVSITDPNTYVSNKYHLEVGTMERYMSTYKEVSREDAQKIVSFLRTNNLQVLDEGYNADTYYKIRIRTLNGNKKVEKQYVVSSKAFMTLISKYLKDYSETEHISNNAKAEDTVKG